LVALNSSHSAHELQRSKKSTKIEAKTRGDIGVAMETWQDGQGRKQLLEGLLYFSRVLLTISGIYGQRLMSKSAAR
jgi:hypothetical protein